MNNTEKFNYIYKTYFTYVERICRKFANRDEYLKEEWTQEAFIKIYNNIDGVNLDCCKTFINRITANNCIDRLRTKKLFHDQWVSINNDSENNNIHEIEYNDDPISDTYNYLLNKLGQRNPESLKIFKMHIEDKMRHEEIAIETGMNATSVRASYFRSRKFLKEIVLNENLM